MEEHIPAWLRRRLAHAAPALAALILCTMPARAQSLDALYQKAKAEGSVVLYAGGPTAPWEARHPMSAHGS